MLTDSFVADVLHLTTVEDKDKHDNYIMSCSMSVSYYIIIKIIGVASFFKDMTFALVCCA